MAVTGVPHVRGQTKTGEPKSPEEGSLHPHSRLKAGVSGEQEHPDGDLHRGINQPNHTHLQPGCLPTAPLLWLPMGWTLVLPLPLARPGEAIEKH